MSKKLVVTLLLGVSLCAVSRLVAAADEEKKPTDKGSEVEVPPLAPKAVANREKIDMVFDKYTEKYAHERRQDVLQCLRIAGDGRTRLESAAEVGEPSARMAVERRQGEGFSLTR